MGGGGGGGRVEGKKINRLIRRKVACSLNGQNQLVFNALLLQYLPQEGRRLQMQFAVIVLYFQFSWVFNLFVFELLNSKRKLDSQRARLLARTGDPS